MPADAVIVGPRVALPGGPVERNVVIEGGRIAALTTAEPACDRRIDGRGLLCIPGAIDPHVHYGVYSPIDEAARTESRAAAAGGVTTMMRMLRLGGPYREQLPAQLEASARSHLVDYAVHASVFDEAQAAEMPYCASAGVASFKVYMNLGSEIGHVYMDMPPGGRSLVERRVEMGEAALRAAVRGAASLGCPLLVHAEDHESCSCGMREARERGRDGLAAWSESRSPEYEARAISQVAALGREYGCAIYVVHVGSAAALRQVSEERRRGTRMYVETCPHYMALAHGEQEGYLAKVMPPIRTAADREAVWRAAAAGEVDTVGTDHVANRLGPKLAGGDVWGALAGFPGVGTSLPLLLSEGLSRGRLSLGRLLSLTSGAAARIFSMAPAKGSLLPGADADVAMLDLRLERRVRAGMFGEYSDYSVYEGRVLRGWPVRTLVRGEVVAEGLEAVGRPGHGRMAPRRILGPAAGPPQ